MSESVVRQRVRFFKDGRTNIHDESRIRGLSIVNVDLIKEIDEKICLLRNFTICQLSEHFPNISLTALYEAIMGKLGYRKVCARWVLINTHGDPQNQSNGRCFRISFPIPHGWGGLFEQNSDRWRNLDSACHCGDKTTVYDMESYQLSIPTEKSPSNFVSEETDDYRFLGCSRNLAYWIHDAWNNNHFQSLLSQIKETEKEPPRTNVSAY